MKYKRTITASVITLTSLLLLCVTALSCFFLFVPAYVESDLIPSILKDSGIEVSSLKVRSIGFSGAEISDISIGPDHDEGFYIDSIRVDYRLTDLTRRKVKKITLSGIAVDASYKNGMFSIKGLEKILAVQKSDTNTENPSEPFNIENLHVKNSVLNLQYEESSFIIPFDFTASSFSQYQLPSEYTLKTSAGGNIITVEGRAENTDKIRIKIFGDNISLNCFEDIISSIVPLNIMGKCSLDLEALLSLDQFSLSDISILLGLNKTGLNYAGITVKNPVGNENIEQPVRIKITSKESLAWEYEVSPVSIYYDAVNINADLSGNIELEGSRFSGQTNAVTRFISKDNLPPFEWSISADGDMSTKNITLRVNGKSTEETGRIKADDIKITALSPIINAELKYDGKSLSGSYRADLKKISAQTKEMSFSTPQVSVKGKISQSEDLKDFISSFSVTGGANFKGFEMNADMPDCLIKGSVKYNIEKGLKADALLSFKNGAVKMEDGSLNINKISGELPGAWPFYRNSGKGRLSVKEVNYKEHSIGPVDINIPVEGSNISFNGTVKYSGLSDMPIKVSGSTSLDDPLSGAELRLEIPEYKPASDINLGNLVPDFKGFSFNGQIKSSGGAKISNAILSSGLDFNIENGKLSNNEKKLTFENITLNFRLDDLVNLKSPFGQKLKVDKVSLGGIEVTDFMVDFRLDSLTSVFIEQGKFKWCGGNINIQSFRIETDKDEYLLTLFCDRIRLADILEQFGVKGVSGGGSVNGKIPVTISNGKIIFEDGFLYSTPGGGGKINITGTDIFKKGMTPGTPEYIQMDIAGEALKAFDYSWVKMALNSIDEDLMVKLQFDGKPEKKLPFRYDQNLNRFMRVDASSEGSNFQGISLDVNLKLPLDELLNYKGALDMIEF